MINKKKEKSYAVYDLARLMLNAATPAPMIANRIAITRNTSVLAKSVLVVAEQLVQALPFVELASDPTPVTNTAPTSIADIASPTIRSIISRISIGGDHLTIPMRSRPLGFLKPMVKED